jgi:protein ImuB
MARRMLSLWFPQIPANWSGGPADLQNLALWCQQYTPLTAPDPPDGVLLDITGCAHLFGGEAGLRAHMSRRLPQARVAIANTATAAWALARFGEGDGEDISPLPLAALNLPAKTITKLRRVGVRRIGELQRLPRAELTAGFGAAPVLQLERALGRAPEVLPFFNAPPDWRELSHYAEPIFAPAQLQAALDRLTARLCARLATAELGATLLEARFHRVDSQAPKIALGFAAPCRDECQIFRLLKEKLQEIDPGFGVEAISLQAVTTETLTPTQRGMEAPAPDYTQPLNTLLNRLGGNKIWRVARHETHIPEFAARRLNLTAAPIPWGRQRLPRPIKLLARPDAITAMAPVPDDPPVLFVWQGKTHKIARATGPERIARDWWRHAHDNARPEAEQIRDYYAVEDVAGARFWLFRAGMHGGAAPVRWFLHGFFG